MKIPATIDGEVVYIVAFDTRNPPSAIVIRSDGTFGYGAELNRLTVLPYAEDEFIPTSFVPPAPDAD
jgi:hypothetical protein